MSILWTLLIFCVAMAWCDQKCFVIKGWREKRRTKLFVVLLLLPMIYVAGLRTRFNDTRTYIGLFNSMPELSGFSFEKYSLGENPGFMFILSCIKTLTDNAQVFILLFAAFTLIAYILVLREYSPWFAMTVFLFFTDGYFGSTLAAVKQWASMAIALIACHLYFTKQKKILFFVLIIAAATIHPYILMYLLVPFLTHRPWGKETYFETGVTLAGAVFMPQLISLLVNITSQIGEGYTSEEFSGIGLNIFRVAVRMMPVVLSFMYREKLFSTEVEPVYRFVVNASIVSGFINFIGLFGTANYFGRLSDYFGIWRIVAIPWMIVRIGGKNARFITAVAIIGYCLYFFYQNGVIMQFDLMYDSVTLIEFLRSLA